MKQRFSSLDVKVIAHELNNSISTFRITNLYDLSSRIFLIKLHAPDKKEHLVIDSGFRCHLTSFVRTTAAAPSPFVQRLRKFLKSRRITSVSQIGTDRIIEITFSDGLYRLFLEFYASGNIVLTDGDLKIIALLRNVSEGDAHEQLKLGVQYNLTNRQNYAGVPPLTKERVKSGLRIAMDKINAQAAKKDKYARSSTDMLRKSLALSLTELPPMLLDHGLAAVGFDKDTSPEDVLSEDSVLDKLMEALQEASKIVTDVLASPTVTGYILQKSRTGLSKTQDTSASISEETSTQSRTFYDDFHPFKPKQFAAQPSITFVEIEGYNKTVDEFFSSIEGQRLESRLHEREENARKRLDQARSEHEKRIAGLQGAQQLQIRKAEAIEANLDRVEEARAAINSLIAQGMDWVDISRLIETEQKRGNSVAQMIKLPLKLYENTATLLLSEPSFEEEKNNEGYETESFSDSSEEDDSVIARKSKKQAEDCRLPVDIDLDLSSWANASQYYDQKRTAVKKEEKTVQASKRALKSAKEKIDADLKKALKTEKDVLRTVRKQHWFEKFLYFISSEGYLVLGGRDAQQTDLIYRKYLRKGDLYVHADLQGASSVVVKNNPSTPDAPIPPSTLSQAGSFSVCSSQAWDNKAVMSAWWVNADQVSKTMPSGELVKAGEFIIRGSKTFLPPSQLLLGFAVIFEISEDSKAHHRKHRVVEDVEVNSKQEEGSLDARRLTDIDTQVSQAQVNEIRSSASLENGDNDEDEEFPDVTLETSSPRQDSDFDSGDSEEDFPDFKLDDPNVGVAVEDDEDGKLSMYNPLQESSRTISFRDKRNGNELRSGSLDINDVGKESVKVPGETTKATHKATRQESSPSNTQQDLPVHGIDSSNNVSDALGEAPRSSEGFTPRKASPHQRPGQTPQPRGKRGKQKKLASKYADQDEEDREMAMQLLGSKVGQERAKAEVEAQKKKREEEELQRQRRREQHLKAQASAEQKRRRALDDEGKYDGNGSEDEEDEINAEGLIKSSLLRLDSFVGRPLPGDTLLGAIPICAPWTALNNYKYRIKLQPGNEKRGKAVRQILGKWDADSKVTRNVDVKSQDPERMWQQEIDLIKGWKEAEVVGIVPVAKMKVMNAGGGGSGSGTAGKAKAKHTTGKTKGGKGGSKK